MNIAILLHSTKLTKDSTLPLPLAPVYVLPANQWYFSSPTLTPLRKRRQNTSLSKYFQQNNNSVSKSKPSSQTQFLCVYEKDSYLKNKIKHIYETVYSHMKDDSFELKQIQCQCSQTFQQNRVKLFQKKPKKIGKYQQSEAIISQKDQNKTVFKQQVNWTQVMKTVSVQHLGAIEQQNMSIYKLPKQQNSQIFSILWNSNYVIFNNSNEKTINQFMKSKAIKLCQILHVKLEDRLWAMMQQHLSMQEETHLSEKVVTSFKSMMQIEKFNVWFYKKEENNEIYIVNVSHISFKGINCVIYNHSNVEEELRPENNTKQNWIFINQKAIIQQDRVSLNNKIKSYSLNITELKQDKYLQKLGKPNTKKIRQMATKKKQKEKQTTQISYVQCACCKIPLLTTDKINEIAAKHIEQIRYLKQMRINKQQSNPYDFAKICPECYQVYLEHYKNTIGEQNRPIKVHSKQAKEQTRDSINERKKIALICKQQKSNLLQVNLENEIYQYQLEETSYPNRIKFRAKSELQCHKEKTEEKIGSYFNNQNLKKENSVSVKYYMNNPLPNKTKKVFTTNTSNTENTIPHRDQFQIYNNRGRERSMTQQQPKQSQTTMLSRRIHNDKSFKIEKTKRRVISSKQNTSGEEPYSFSIEQNQQVKKQIANAISDYLEIQRPSFKRLALKNHRNYAKKQLSQLSRVQDHNLEV